MTQLFANNASTTLNGAINNSVTSIPLTDSTEFPTPSGSDYFLATLFDVSSGAWEVVKCTDNTANVLTVTRGHEGAALAFDDDDLIQANLTQATMVNLPQLDVANTFTDDQTVQGEVIGDNFQFPATQVPSADANNLDDYEEGTVTVAFSSAGGSITIDTSLDTLTYTKKGREVTYQGSVTVLSVSSPTGSLGLTGLGFTSSNENPEGADISAAGLRWSGLSGAINAAQGRITSSSTTLNLEEFTGTAAAGMADKIQAGSILQLNLTHVVNT